MYKLFKCTKQNKNILFEEFNNRILVTNNDNYIINGSSKKNYIYKDNENNLCYFSNPSIKLLEKKHMLICTAIYEKHIISEEYLMDLLNKYKSISTIRKYLGNKQIEERKKELIRITIMYSFKNKKIYCYYNNNKILLENVSGSYYDFVSKFNPLFKFFSTPISNVENTTLYNIKNNFEIKNFFEVLKCYPINEYLLKFNLGYLVSTYSTKRNAKTLEEYFNTTKQSIMIFLDYKRKYSYNRDSFLNEIFNFIDDIYLACNKNIDMTRYIFESVYSIILEENVLNNYTFEDFRNDFKEILITMKSLNPNVKLTDCVDFIINSIFKSQCLKPFKRAINEYDKYLKCIKEYKDCFDIEINKNLLYTKHLLSDTLILETNFENERNQQKDVLIQLHQESNYKKYKINDLNIYGFYFKTPKSTKDLIYASNKLNNCLNSYGDIISRNRSFVFYVYKEESNELYGAVEIKNYKIIQARIIYNSKMPEKITRLFEDHLNSLINEKEGIA